MTDFNEMMVKHIVDRLLVEIDKGTTERIHYTVHDPTTGTSRTELQEVNVRDRIVSRITQKLIDDPSVSDRLKKKLDAILESEEFQDTIAARTSDNLISWLEEKSGWYGSDDRYKNRAAFNKEVRAQVVKIVAKAEADKIMSKAQDAA